MITKADLESARKAFQEHESRDLFYRAAMYLVEEALEGDAPLSVAEALAVLLQTWNRAYYQYHPFDSNNFSKIERLLEEHQGTLDALRDRRIESFESAEDQRSVQHLFTGFEQVLGPVGASECLHLLAPPFFPLWDRAIADAYELSLGNRGTNPKRYCDFMAITREQTERLGAAGGIDRNPLKAIDEYNYCRHTKGWI